MAVELTFLIDNKPGAGLAYEHGLSIYIDTGEQKILFDTGRSGVFTENAAQLGINLAEIDYAIISHGHYDHGDGLSAFLAANAEAPVYMHPAAKLPVYYSTHKDGSPRYIGISQEIFRKFPQRFIDTDTMFEPSRKIHILPCSGVPGRGPIFDDGSIFLLEGSTRIKENFDHEIFMIIEREADFILISGCSHNNIIAIIDYSRRMFPDKNIAAVVGGFHLPDISSFTDKHQSAIHLTTEKLERIYRENRADDAKPGTETLFFTGHCTGDRAKVILKAKLNEKIDFFNSGYRISL